MGLMGEQDVIKLGIGLDLAALERDAKRIPQVLAENAKLDDSQAKKTVAGKLVNLMEDVSDTTKDTTNAYKDMVKLAAEDLRLQERRLQMIKEQDRVGGGGKGGRGRGGGEDDGSTPRYQQMGMRRPTAAGAVAGGIRALDQLSSAGFTESSMYNVGGDIASGFGPWGKALGAALRFAGSAAAKAEELGEARLNVFRAGGAEARGTLMNATEDKDYLQMKYGLNFHEMAMLTTALVKATGSAGELAGVSRTQGLYGLGGEATSLLGGVTRGGGSVDTRVIATAFGVAVAQQLDQGRWGEAFTALTRAAQSSIQGNFDLRQAARTQAFIGSLGDRFKGDTASAQAAGGLFDQMVSGGGGGLSEIMALRAGGFGRGRDFFQAKLAMSRGRDKEGGISTEEIVRQYADMPHVKNAWKNGQPEMAAWFVCRAAGLPESQMGLVIDILRGFYAKGGAFPDIDLAAGARVFESDAAGLPAEDMARVKGQIRSEKKAGVSKSILRGYFFGWFGNKVLDEAGWKDPKDAGNVGTGESGFQGRSGMELAGGGTAPNQGPVVTPLQTQGDRFASQYGGGVDEMSWMQKRSTTPVKTDHGYEYQKGERNHMAQDVYLPPGSTVYLPVDGVYLRSVYLDDNLLWKCEFRGDNGILYAFLHLTKRPPFEPGTRLKAGTALGQTRKDRFKGGSRSHVHVEAKDREGNKVKPSSTLTEAQLYMMATGRSEVPSSEPTRQEPPASDRQPVQAPQPTGGDSGEAGAAPATGSAGGGPQAARGGRTDHLVVAVYDHRISVTRRSAGAAAVGGAPGQIYSFRPGV